MLVFRRLADGGMCSMMVVVVPLGPVMMASLVLIMHGMMPGRTLMVHPGTALMLHAVVRDGGRTGGHIGILIMPRHVLREDGTRKRQRGGGGEKYSGGEGNRHGVSPVLA